MEDQLTENAGRTASRVTRAICLSLDIDRSSPTIGSYLTGLLSSLMEDFTRLGGWDRGIVGTVEGYGAGIHQVIQSSNIDHPLLFVTSGRARLDCCTHS